MYEGECLLVYTICRIQIERNLKNEIIPFCVRSLYLESEKYSDGDWDILLSENLNNQGYKTQISNTNYYGGII